MPFRSTHALTQSLLHGLHHHHPRLARFAPRPLAKPLGGAIAGALLVDPADPERRSVLADFAPVRTAGAYARAWGSEFVRLQNAGHINLEAGFGPWPLGLALLQSLLGEARGLS